VTLQTKKETRLSKTNVKNRRMLFLVAAASILLTLSVSGCSKDAKSQVVGKWEVTLNERGTDTKTQWEFFPDGSYTCAPLGDPGTILDKDKYEIIDEGRRVKIKSQFLPVGSILTVNGNSMTFESSQITATFKQL